MGAVFRGGALTFMGSSERRRCNGERALDADANNCAAGCADLFLRQVQGFSSCASVRAPLSLRESEL
jgi:hypothetical protein